MTFLTDAQIDAFQDRGYLLVEGLIDTARICAPIERDYTTLLDGLTEQLVREGRLSSTWSGLPFGERVIKLYQETGELFIQHFNISVPPKAGIPADIPICLAPSVFRALTNDVLLDAVESLIGPEIAINPVQHTRIKPPSVVLDSAGASRSLHGALGITPDNGLVARTPWHQDNAVLTPDADQTEMVTVWFPITDASIDMGCLAVQPGSHRGGLRTHCPSRTTDLFIPAAALDDQDGIPIPMKRGDALFLHPHMCHSSRGNQSQAIRWSFDLRYQRRGQPSGRAILPTFVARSREAPETIVRDPDTWARTWRETIHDLSRRTAVSSPHRWSADAALCA
ncbi:MAG: phytanoyl-CoA dioxygenase family protein [Alphaproteobacteria bacterium]|nr:phytanoyl-CoA dioxygenase family protein [Alphaproteobacteria bacterium]